VGRKYRRGVKRRDLELRARCRAAQAGTRPLPSHSGQSFLPVDWQSEHIDQDTAQP
jgi:hypothetical protein